MFDTDTNKKEGSFVLSDGGYFLSTLSRAIVVQMLQSVFYVCLFVCSYDYLVKYLRYVVSALICPHAVGST